MPANVHHTARLSTPQPSLIAPDLWSSDIIPRLPSDLETQAHALHALQRVVCKNSVERFRAHAS